MKSNKNPRISFDNYPTPQQLADAAFEFLKNVLPKSFFMNGMIVMEPGCGNAQPFLQAACKDPIGKYYYGEDCRTVEPANEKFVIAKHNYFKKNPNELMVKSGFDKVDLIMMNPPFTDAKDFVEKSFTFLKPFGVIFMLGRQSFLMKTKDRKSFWENYPPSFISQICPRPSFTSDGGTDGCEYMFFVWCNWLVNISEKQSNETPTKFSWTEWKKEERKRKC